MAISEAEWRREVIELARRSGWLVSYIPNSTRVVGDRGVPDLTLARAGTVLLVELKREGARPTARQRRWIAQAGDHGRLWSPSDREAAEAELRRPPDQSD